MRTDNVRKYVLPNLPYLFFFWFCLKLGTAFRLAAGDNFAVKLVNMGQTIGPAFQSGAPGVHGSDWLIGMIGTAALRLIIYIKAKNAKKYRKDVEYGSAR